MDENGANPGKPFLNAPSILLLLLLLLDDDLLPAAELKDSCATKAGPSLSTRDMNCVDILDDNFDDVK